jgi:predicted RNA binding protein YcfA (HicA-like mRNA interferase family)
MPAKAKDLMKVAGKLGFQAVRQRGSHAIWKHPDGRWTTIPVHGNSEIGNYLFHDILKQLGISQKDFKNLI